MKKILDYKFDGRKMESTEIIDKIFDNRGVKDINKFLVPDEDDMIPFSKMKNIDKAFDVVDEGILLDYKFLIYADTDVDGCTSGAIMYRFLSNFTDNIEITINEGKAHGIKDYDVSKCDADIILIVDSINEAQEYNKFVNAGKQVVVLDHHIIPSFNDNVIYVSSANDYPNPHLSGAGVVWKFCKYCDTKYDTTYADNLTDLAATGIIADMCDMTSPENRYICYQGLRNVQNEGIKAIKGGYLYNAQAVSFSVAPLINAANRLNDNWTALKCFIDDDVKVYKKKLANDKEEQNFLVSCLMDDVMVQVESQINNKVMMFICDVKEGVLGLIANKLADKYKRPVIVVKPVDDAYKGSMRGYGVDNFKAIIDKTNLARAEGHENAAGIEFDVDDFESLQNFFEEELADIEFEIKSEADVYVEPSQITSDLIQQFKNADYISGTGFPQLKICTVLTDYELSHMSNYKHLKIVCDDFIAIKWNYTGDWSEFKGRSIKIIGSLNSGYFGKTFYNQIIIDEYEVLE